MSPKTRSSRRWMDSCAIQLHSWKPFSSNHPKTQDPDSSSYKTTTTTTTTLKRPCLSLSIIDALDNMSRLSLFDDSSSNRFRWKRRRRGASRSLSGRSSDRSGTRNGRCCSVGATATCSDFMVVAGATDSSGELFVNGSGNWSSDVAEVRNLRRERGDGNGIGEKEKEKEKEGAGSGLGLDAHCTESGYGSEPGYRGDAEFGDGDEFDEEDDARFPLWGERFADPNTEMVGENTFAEQKMHYRGRRKKNDFKMIDSVR